MKLQGRTAKLGLLFRTATIEGIPKNWRQLEEESGERFDRIEISFSSEFPVRRYWGTETLGHKRSEVDLARLRDGGALLKDHDPTIQTGVHEKVWLDTDSRKGRALVRFGNTPAAEEERVEVLDGIRTKVSTGYVIHELTLEKSDETGDHFRATRWEPVESSIVAIPADVTVGVGREISALPELAARAAEYAEHVTQIVRPKPTGDRKMILVTRKSDGAVLRIEESAFDAELYDRFEMTPPAPPAPTPTPAPEPVRSRESEEDARARATQQGAEDERKRIRSIRELAVKFNSRDLGDAAVDSGMTFADFRDQLFVEGRTPTGQPRRSHDPYPAIEDPPGFLGLSRRDLEGYSILRALRAHVSHEPALAEHEFEISREIAKRAKREPQGIFVPMDLLGVPIPRMNDPRIRERIEAELALRAISSSTQGGGSLIATDLLAGSFIDVLREISVVTSMGATFLPGLVGDVDIPRQATAGVGTWMAEAGTITATELSLDVVSMTPKTLANKMVVTRKMLLQSTPAIEGIVRTDMAISMALGIDKAAIQGSGSGAVPEGVLNMSGIGIVPIGANGGPMTWAAQVALQTEVAAANALVGALGFVTSPAAQGHMLTEPKETGYPVYILQEPGNASLGHRVLASNQVPTNLTKGTGTDLTAEIFGNWRDLLVGEWGLMDLMPDPYSLADNAMLTVRVFQDADVAARHEESFAACVDIDTA